MDSGMQIYKGSDAQEFLTMHGLATESLMLELEVYEGKLVTARLTGFALGETSSAYAQRREEVMTRLDQSQQGGLITKATLAGHLLDLVRLGLGKARGDLKRIVLYGVVASGFIDAIDYQSGTTLSSYRTEAGMTNSKFTRFGMSSLGPSRERVPGGFGVAILRHIISGGSAESIDKDEQAKLERALIQGNIIRILQEAEVHATVIAESSIQATGRRETSAESRETQQSKPIATKRKADELLADMPKQTRLDTPSSAPPQTQSNVEDQQTSAHDNILPSFHVVLQSKNKMDTAGRLVFAADGSRLSFVTEGQVLLWNAAIDENMQMARSKTKAVVKIITADGSEIFRFTNEAQAYEDREAFVKAPKVLRDAAKAAVAAAAEMSAGDLKRKAEDHESPSNAKKSKLSEDGAKVAKPAATCTADAKAARKIRKKRKAQVTTPAPNEVSSSASGNLPPGEYHQGRLVLTSDNQSLMWYSYHSPNKVEIPISEICSAGKMNTEKKAGAFERPVMWIYVNLNVENSDPYWFSFSSARETKQATDTLQKLERLLKSDTADPPPTQPIVGASAPEAIDLTEDELSSGTDQSLHETIDLSGDDDVAATSSVEQASRASSRSEDPAHWYRDAVKTDRGRKYLGIKSELWDWVTKFAPEYLTEGSFNSKYTRKSLHSILKLYMVDHPIVDGTVMRLGETPAEALPAEQMVEFGTNFIGVVTERLRNFLRVHGLTGELHLLKRDQLVPRCQQMLRERYPNLVPEKINEDVRLYDDLDYRDYLAGKLRKHYNANGGPESEIKVRYRDEEFTVDNLRRYLRACGAPYDKDAWNKKRDELLEMAIQYLEDNPKLGQELD